MQDHPFAAHTAQTQAGAPGAWPMDDLRGRILREISEQNQLQGGIVIGVACGLGLVALLAGLA